MTALSCSCGTVTGTLRARPRGMHIICHCGSCRAAHQHLTGTDVEYVSLYMNVPDAIDIATGLEQVQAIKLSSKGPLRWYAQCCKTPIANTLRSAKLPFATLHAGFIEDQSTLGPVRAEAFRPNGQGTKGGLAMGAGVLTRMITARLSGRWRNTPFFDADGAPIRDIERVNV